MTSNWINMCFLKWSIDRESLRVYGKFQETKMRRIHIIESIVLVRILGTWKKSVSTSYFGEFIAEQIWKKIFLEI